MPGGAGGSQLRARDKNNFKSRDALLIYLEAHICVILFSTSQGYRFGGQAFSWYFLGTQTFADYLKTLEGLPCIPALPCEPLLLCGAYRNGKLV